MGETWIPADQLRAEVEQLLADVQPGAWEFGVGPHEDDGDPIEWFTKLLDGDVECRDIWTVWVEADDGEPGVIVPAITGNGPRSEAHAKLFAATPKILRLFLKLTEPPEPRPLVMEFFETVRGDAGPDGVVKVRQFWWRVRHTSNGLIVGASSEGYSSRGARDDNAALLHPDLEPVEVEK